MMQINWTQSMSSNKSTTSAKLAQWNIYQATGGFDTVNQHIVQM